jgi:ribosome-associated translation inhibitor RaiA
MHIQINTDQNIGGSARMSAYFTKNLEETFGRFDGEITRIEMYLTDVNGDKEGDEDKRCLLEARLKGLNPVVVTHHAETMDIAVSGAMDKLVKSIESTIGKRRRR